MFCHSLQYQKYLWWKQHLTTLQMIQFVLIMVHGFQLVFYDDCDFPWQFAYYIGAHAILFFILFSEFYVKNYLTKKKSKKVRRWTVIGNFEFWRNFCCKMLQAHCNFQFWNNLVHYIVLEMNNDCCIVHLIYQINSILWFSDLIFFFNFF